MAIGRGIRDIILIVVGVVLDMTISAGYLKFLTPYLPFAWLGILAYLTWDFLHWKPMHNLGVSAYAKLGIRNPMISYLVVAVMGAVLFAGYWWGVQKVFESRDEAKKLAQQTVTDREVKRMKDEDIVSLPQPQEPMKTPPASIPQRQPQRVENAEDELADFIEQGTAIQKRFIETNDTNRIVREKREWRRRAEEYLEQNLGRSYAIQFRNAQGSAWMGMPAGRSIAGGTVWQEIEGKKNMLGTFISELRSKPHNPS